MLATRTVLALLVAMAAGALAGALGAYAQHYVVGQGRLPLGVLLALLLTAAIATVVRSALASRLTLPALASGWLAVVTVASGRRREGDVLVPADGRGWAFLVGGALVLGLSAALPVRRPGAAS